VSQEQQEDQVKLENQDQSDHVVPKERKEISVTTAVMVTMDHQDVQVPQEKKETLD
jgi:hypothetical protein